MPGPALALALAATLALAGCGGGDRSSPAPTRQSDPPRADLPPGDGHLLARVLAPVLVHGRPGGRPIARLRRRTPFGQPRTLGVLETRERGRWLGVHSPVLGNERVGWVENDAAKLSLRRTDVELRVDLTSRRVELRRAGRPVRRIPIAIGAAGTSTPPGRFQVTDKLHGQRFPRADYGCCILALSARQPNLPPGWPGGDRIAIHGTPDAQSIGTASSTGCLRATDADLRVLMRDVPVGAPVFIQR